MSGDTSGDPNISAFPEKPILAMASGAWPLVSCDVADRLTEWFLYAIVVFSPWAFGTTQVWAMWVMNVCGYTLGALLLFKWAVRRASGYYPPQWETAANGQRKAFGVHSLGCQMPPNALKRGHQTRMGSQNQNCCLTKVLGGTTIAILVYCLVSALNARAHFSRDDAGFQYHDFVAWLPHSYDSPASWQSFWNYLALACDFWAARDWLLTKSWQECVLAPPRPDGAPRLPIRVKRLLWVLSINGALLALEGLLQRATGTTKLLWLLEPRINKNPGAQFGPYAYRSNAAQYLLLLWPVALGFWWALFREASKTRRRFHKYLVPCILVLALAPIASLSRAAILIGSGSIVVAILIMVRFGERVKAGVLLGAAALLISTVLLGAYLEKDHLTKRFGDEPVDSGRVEIWRNTWNIFKDFPVYGTGPGTFESVYIMYLPAGNGTWHSYAHNDWLELLATFGSVGALLVLGALLVALAHPFFGGRIRVSRAFVPLLYLALANCLVFALVDFPFVVYSVLLEFLIVCALLTCMSQQKSRK